jgi:hypothetical protein
LNDAVNEFRSGPDPNATVFLDRPGLADLYPAAAIPPKVRHLVAELLDAPSNRGSPWQPAVKRGAGTTPQPGEMCFAGGSLDRALGFAAGSGRDARLRETTPMTDNE